LRLADHGNGARSWERPDCTTTTARCKAVRGRAPRTPAEPLGKPRAAPPTRRRYLGPDGVHATSGRPPLTPDVVVVGGGLIGCLAARAAARDGWVVVLAERAAALGSESTSAAAGMLSPQMEAAEEILVAGGAGAGPRRDAMLELCLAGRDRYPAFVRELEAETGRSTHYRGDGTLVVAQDEEEAGRLAARAAEQRARGLRAEWLERADARALEPGIAPRAVGALHLPDDHQIDNVALLAAVEASVRSLPGIEVRIRTSVLGLAVENGRTVGVRTAEGTLPAGAVVLAAGAWSSAVAGLPARVEIRPVKGQMAALRSAVTPFRRVVGGRSVYCVPRDDGRIIVGATVEEAGFDKRVDPRAIQRLLAAAVEIVPALAAAPLHASWAGLRPGTADDLPVLGPDPEVGGLLWATGHYRNGILLAPVTAHAIAALLRGEPSPVELGPFAPGRPAPAPRP